MSSFVINVQDVPINLTNVSGNIQINQPDRCYITDSSMTIHKIQKIIICDPSGGYLQTFDIIFTYGTTTKTSIYLQVPVKVGKFAEKFINKEFTEFMEDATGTQPFQCNLSELFNSISNDNFFSVNNTTSNNTTTVIRTNVIYLNVSDPTKNTSTSPISSFSSANTRAIVTIKTAPKPLSFRISPNTNNENPDSKYPRRTIPIEIYDGSGNTFKKTPSNPDYIKQGIKDNLSTYTGLMISCIVIGFIMVTGYIIFILIPDSKLRIQKTPKGGGGGGWSFRNSLRAFFANLQRK
jgi:hypothetical protein